MTKRTALLAILASLLLGGWGGVIATMMLAGQPRSDDPMLRARDYAMTHQAQYFPKGTQLHYSAFEAGDVWLVEVSDMQTIGGGSRFLVFRNSDRVEAAGRTQ